MISYFSSGFEKLFLKKISDPGTHEFVICTGYARHSYIERFDDSSVDPGSNFSNKLRRLLIGDPLGHSIKERKEIDGKLGEKVLFCDKLKFNKNKRAFNPIVHSKIFIGFDGNKKPIWAMVGSNNFTNNGMRDNNQESMLYIENTAMLQKIELHFNAIRKLCDRLSSLNLDLITGKRIDGGYTITLSSPKNQTIDPIFVIEVLIEDGDELSLATSADSILLECIESSELLEKTSDGLYRPFVIIFVDDVKLEKRKSIIVKYGYSRASIAINRGADPYSGSPDGYIRYFGDTIADFSKVRVVNPDNHHTHDIPFINLASASDFVATKSNLKSEKMAKIINDFLKVSDLDELQKAYSLVSKKKHGKKKRVDRSVLDDSFDDKQVVSILEVVELIPEHHFDSLEGKMGYLGPGSLSGKDAHEKDDFSLKQDNFEGVSAGFKEMKKQYPGEYSTIVNSAVDVDVESQ